MEGNLKYAKYRFQYALDRRLCICAIEDENGKLSIGLAFRNQADSHSKREARMWAKDRAEFNPIIVASKEDLCHAGSLLRIVQEMVWSVHREETENHKDAPREGIICIVANSFAMPHWCVKELLK